MYFYERDAVGNINHLIDKDGNIVVSYSCKAYGQDMSYVDNTSFGLGDINPFRYKRYNYERSLESYKSEWKAHTFAYCLFPFGDWGKSTRSVNLDKNEEDDIYRFIYWIF